MPPPKRPRTRLEEDYSQVRKPMPPPARVEKDKRRKLRNKQDRRETAEEAEDPQDVRGP